MDKKLKLHSPKTWLIYLLLVLLALVWIGAGLHADRDSAQIQEGFLQRLESLSIAAANRVGQFQRSHHQRPHVFLHEK